MYDKWRHLSTRCGTTSPAPMRRITHTLECIPLRTGILQTPTALTHMCEDRRYINISHVAQTECLLFILKLKFRSTCLLSIGGRFSFLGLEKKKKKAVCWLCLLRFNQPTIRLFLIPIMQLCLYNHKLQSASEILCVTRERKNKMKPKKEETPGEVQVASVCLTAERGVEQYRRGFQSPPRRHIN